MKLSRRLLAVLIVPSALILAACGGDNDPTTNPGMPMGTPSPGPGTGTATAVATGTPCEPVVLQPTGDITPLVLSSELVVGENRFAFAIDKGGKLYENAEVQVSFFAPCAETAAQATAATWRGLATEEEDHSHDGPTESTQPHGLYTVPVSFSEPGAWLAEFAVSGLPEPVRFQFSVREESTVPGIGEPAPPSETATLQPGVEIKTIDTSVPPDPDFHDVSIAGALAAQKPALVMFATPAFCRSRTCGPVVEEVSTLYPEYGERVEFIHVEPYKLDANGQPVGDSTGQWELVPAMTEWGFPSEPWVVLIDAQGLVAAKFEGLTNAEEVREALDAMLAS